MHTNILADFRNLLTNAPVTFLLTLLITVLSLLNVETIAFFFKLLWDHKVLGKISLQRLSEQIAAYCLSVGKDEFQATTIFSRFFVKMRR